MHAIRAQSILLIGMLWMMMMTITTAHFHSEIAAGWIPTTVSDENQAMLLQAVANPKKYQNSQDPLVCIQDVLAVQEEIVNGINFAFTALGCLVAAPPHDGKCTADCNVIPMNIVLFVQPWTNTLDIIRVIH